MPENCGERREAQMVVSLQNRSYAGHLLSFQKDVQRL